MYEALYLADSVEEIGSNIATPGVNWLAPLIVCKVYKVNNRLEMFEKKKSTLNKTNNAWFTYHVLL